MAARGKQRGDMRGQRESGAKSPKSKSGVHGRRVKKEVDESKEQPGGAADKPGAPRRRQTARGKKKECKEQVVSEMDQIITGLIRKAKQGSVSHAKFLLDFAEEEPGAEAAAAESEKDAAGESLAEVLLQRLEHPKDPQLAATEGANKRPVRKVRQANASRKTVISSRKKLSSRRAPQDAAGSTIPAE